MSDNVIFLLLCSALVFVSCLIYLNRERYSKDYYEGYRAAGYWLPDPMLPGVALLESVYVASFCLIVGGAMWWVFTSDYWLLATGLVAVGINRFASERMIYSERRNLWEAGIPLREIPRGYRGVRFFNWYGIAAFATALLFGIFAGG